MTNPDGTGADFIEHLSRVRQKGIKGYTEEYLKTLHVTPHQPNREPPPEHTHLKEA